MDTTQNQLTHVLHAVHRLFIWLVVGSYVLAAIVPQFGLWIRSASLGRVPIAGGMIDLSFPAILLAWLLFNAGLGVKPRELRKLLTQPFVLVVGLVANLAIPLAFIALLSQTMRIWHNPEEVQQILVGLALVASMPIAGSSTAWSQNANGNLTLSLGLVLLSTLLSPLVTPLGMHTVGFLTTGDYSEDLHELASGGVGTFLGVWVILPSMLGLGLRTLITDRGALLVQPWLKLVNWAVILLLNYSNASLSLPQAIAEPDYDYLAIILVISLTLCVTAFVAGAIVSRVFRADDGQRVSLMFALGMNNNGTGLVLAGMALADHPQVMLPIIFYNLVQHLVAACVDAFVLRKTDLS